MRGRTLTEVCAPSLAGSAEREAASSRLERLGLCARPQTAEKFWASPPRHLPPPSRQFLVDSCFHPPPSLLVSNPLLLSPRRPPAEALLGRPLELQAESGSVGHLRQQAQAGRAPSVTWVLRLPQRSSAHDNWQRSIDTLHFTLLFPSSVHLRSTTPIWSATNFLSQDPQWLDFFTTWRQSGSVVSLPIPCW